MINDLAESIKINGESKSEKYISLIPQLNALIEGETDFLANLGNILAGLKQSFGFLWIGLYFAKGKDMVLGPFQGPVACSRIAFGKGVCGTCWKEKKTMIVPDVDKFPGHIACSSDSRSEIVLPGINSRGEVIFVLDVDSQHLNDFDEVDEKYLGEVVGMILKLATRVEIDND